MVTDFPSPPSLNLSGYSYFQFAPFVTVASIPAPVSKIVNQPVQFKDNYSFRRGYATLETLEFEEPSEGTIHGTLYRPSIKGFVPGDSPELVILIEVLEQLKHVITITGNDGRTRLVGVSGGLDFRSRFLGGSSPGERRGYEFEFYGDSTHRAYYYNV